MATPQPSMATTRSVLASAVDAIRIVSPNEYMFGRHRVPVPQQRDATGGVLPADESMIRALQSSLYGAVYNRRFDPDVPPAPPSRFTEMADELSRANPGRERWDHGWQVYQTQPNGMIHAHKHGRAQMFYPGQYMVLGGATPAPGASIANGAMVSAYLAKELRHFQEGFYIALGENVQPYYEQTTLVRFYFNLTPDAAAPLLNKLVDRFNRFQVPFRFKCLSYRELYDRFDAGVLFIGRRQWDIAALLVEELYRSIGSSLLPETPLFTKRLAPGLAVAEDPSDGESFGTSRCRFVAEGIWAAYQGGAHQLDDRLNAVASAFARAGLSRERPWLNPGSLDIYDVHLD